MWDAGAGGAASVVQERPPSVVLFTDRQLAAPHGPRPRAHPVRRSIHVLSRTTNPAGGASTRGFVGFVGAGAVDATVAVVAGWADGVPADEQPAARTKVTTTARPGRRHPRIRRPSPPSNATPP